MGDDFLIDVVNGAEDTAITCRGSLDFMPAEKLREVIAVELERGVRRVTLDCSEVTLLTSAGITALVDVAISCREAHVPLDMKLSGHARRILDLVGLWWLGVIDDGISVHASLQTALRSYADQSFDGTIYQEVVEPRLGPEDSDDLELEG